MSITLDAEQIIDEGIVENERVEYKENWNPEPILHTICAFANDIENQGGGYIIIGIKENNGRPGEIVGVDPDSIDSLNSKLFKLCGNISPGYRTDSASMEYHGKTLFVIKASGGADRPYKCRISLSEKNTEKANYIRKMGRTIRANPSDEKELHSISERIPFDDRPNHNATIADLSMGLMYEYLRGSNSKMLRAALQMTPMELASNLHLVTGPREDVRPLNVALLFFNEHPEDFFKNAVIEIVYKPDPTGHNMVENTIKGPLDRQIRDAVSLIRNTYIKEFVTKVKDRPDAIRSFNYPEDAVEEAISNAVYHKGYDYPEPITVYIYPDRMEITSIPGPDLSITDEGLKTGRMASRHNRNRRIGEILKDLKLTEGRNTGVPLMIESMLMNGSEAPVFETDAQRSYLTVILPANRGYLSQGKMEVAKEDEEPSRDNLVSSVLSLLSTNGDMSIREISDALGYRRPPSNLRAVVAMLISGGSVEYTHPESVRHPRQRIRLSNR